MIHNWCRRIPTAESRNPPEKHRAATNIDLRGPTCSTQRPNRAAEAPRNTMAREKTQPISFKFQSCGTDWVNPISFVRGRLKVEKAYAWPMERCTARAAGGTKKRLKPGPAMVLSRSKNDDITSPVLIYGLLRGEIYLSSQAQYAPFPAILSLFAFAGRRKGVRLGSHSAGARAPLHV